MQHHGAPTRMLDWTYSFWVALYFAVARSTKKASVVWALNNDWLALRANEIEDLFMRKANCAQAEKLERMKADGKGWFESTLVQHLIQKAWHQSSLYAVNPYYLNERLAVQRGVFLVPTDLRAGRSWTDNITGMLGDGHGAGDILLHKVHIPYNAASRKSIIEKLADMNINQASLFPGLDGFAQSLRTRIAHPPKGWLLRNAGGNHFSVI